jgi:hypothetical protein
VLPALRGQAPHACQHARPAAADGEETDPTLGQLAQAGIGRCARVEQQASRVAPNAAVGFFLIR